MAVGLIIAIGFGLTFALTNGFHDASNAIATLVATRGATPGSGGRPVGGVQHGRRHSVGHRRRRHHRRDRHRAAEPDGQSVVGAGLAGATRMESPHLVARTAVVVRACAGRRTGRRGDRRRDALRLRRPEVGQLGRLRRMAPDRRHRCPRRADDLAGPGVGLRVSVAATPALDDAAVDDPMEPAGSRRRLGRRGRASRSATAATTRRRRWVSSPSCCWPPVRPTTLTVPLWVKVVTGVALTMGTALGGWRIVKTVGQRLFSLTPARFLHQPGRRRRPSSWALR